MNRLPFVLPDFTRVAWVSGRARAVWEPAVQQFTAAWEHIERLAVLAGVRQAALQVVNPENLGRLSTWAVTHGLVALPIAQEGVTEGYSSTPRGVETGRPWRYRVLLTRAADAVTAAAAWSAGDDAHIGTLLGYPACCRDFFVRWWVGEKMVDTTWPMAQLGTEGPPEANILLRWLGVRLVPHLPCSFACAETVALGQALAEVGRANGFETEVALAREMLSWPIEWDALHGIAEVHTPVCKIVTRTDATPARLVVQRAGTSYPAEGARGLRFPYRAGPQAPVPRARPAHVVPVETPGAGEWQDNGFSSRAAMEAAHQVVAAAALETLDAPAGYVLDLGCGNGLLAERIARGRPDLTPLGVELDAERAKAARRRLGMSEVVWGSISGDWPGSGPYGVVLLMPGRLLELAPEEAMAVRTRLEEMAPRIVLYAYGDVLERHGSLAALARLTGFRLEGTCRRGLGVEAGRGRLSEYPTPASTID